MKKRISIDDLKPGMRVVGLDQSWLRSPLWVHRQLIKSEGDIALLRRSGVREIEIDEGGVCFEEQGVHCPETSAEPEPSPCPDPHPPSRKGTSKNDHPTLQPDPAQSGGIASAADRFDEKLEAARTIRLEAISAVEQVFEGVKTGVELKSDCLAQVTKILLASLMEHEGGMLAEIQLQRMKQFDTSLFAHAVDVCVMALLVGHRSQLPEDQLHILALGALLHDVGQVRLPRNLLTKQGAFTAGERRLYQSHPKLGATIIAEGEGFPDGVRRIVSEHHERIDGKGFPWKRVGSAIFSLAQLVGMVDPYDALVSSRGGRPPVPPALAIRRLYQLGLDGEFAMEWVGRLIQSFGLYPVGSLVELNSGEQGWVIDVNQADSMCPTIKVLWGPGHEPLAEPRIVEFSHYHADGARLGIQRVLSPFELGCAQGYSLPD